MTKTELQGELAKLNEKQRIALRREFPGYKITYLNYDEATDAIAFNVVIKSEYQWTAILPRSGRLIDLRCYKAIGDRKIGYSASR